MLRTITLLLFIGGISQYAFAQNRSVYPDPVPPKILPPNTPSFGPLDASVDAFVRIPEARSTFGVDGEGLAAVVIDSGLNEVHLSFPRKIAGKNFSSDGNLDDTNDDDADGPGPYRPGHGSHVAGIIVGAELDPALGIPSGVAPAATVIPLKVFPGGSQGVLVKEALEWVMENRERILAEQGVRIGVVNMSLGTRQNFKNSSSISPFQQSEMQLIKELRDIGIPVVVSSGNHYFHFQSSTGMSFPAIVPECISVGALYDSTIGSRADGQPLVAFQDGGKVNFTLPGRLTVFTQRLSESEGGIHRTDIFAPGFLVTSAGPFLNQHGQDSRTTRSLHGTSQAAPVVSGMIMLLQQRYLKLLEQSGRPLQLPSVDLIEECLRAGGVEIHDKEDSLAQEIDNVVSSGATDLIRLDAVSSLEKITVNVVAPLHELRLNLFNADDEQERVDLLEASPIGK